MAQIHLEKMNQAPDPSRIKDRSLAESKWYREKRLGQVRSVMATFSMTQVMMIPCVEDKVDADTCIGDIRPQPYMKVRANTKSLYIVLFSAH
jgi:hypothetical protein